MYCTDVPHISYENCTHLRTLKSSESLFVGTRISGSNYQIIFPYAIIPRNKNALFSYERSKAIRMDYLQEYGTKKIFYGSYNDQPLSTKKCRFYVAIDIGTLS